MRPRTEVVLSESSADNNLVFKQLLTTRNLPSVAFGSSCLDLLVKPSLGTNINTISPDSFFDTFKMLRFSQGTHYTMRLMMADN